MAQVLSITGLQAVPTSGTSVQLHAPLSPPCQWGQTAWGGVDGFADDQGVCALFDAQSDLTNHVARECAESPRNL